MNDQWLQGAIVGGIVLAAVAYLLRKYLPRSGKATAEKTCGSCRNCSGGRGGCH